MRLHVGRRPVVLIVAVAVLLLLLLPMSVLPVAMAVLTVSVLPVTVAMSMSVVVVVVVSVSVAAVHPMELNEPIPEVLGIELNVVSIGQKGLNPAQLLQLLHLLLSVLTRQMSIVHVHVAAQLHDGHFKVVLEQQRVDDDGAIMDEFCHRQM